MREDHVGTEIIRLPARQHGSRFGNEIEHLAQRDLRIMSAHKSELPAPSPRRESTCSENLACAARLYGAKRLQALARIGRNSAPGDNPARTPPVRPRPRHYDHIQNHRVWRSQTDLASESRVPC